MADLITTDQLPAPAREFLGRNLARLRSAVAAAAASAGRDRADVRLIAVTKYVHAGVVAMLHDLGVRDFGESRVQDAAAKWEALAELADLRIHLIGHLQRNKARRALEFFSGIHSLDSERLAVEIEALAGQGSRLPDEVYVEVNIAMDPQKTGVPPQGLHGFLERLRACPLVWSRVRGLMGMAPYAPSPEASRPYFRRLRELRDASVAAGLLSPGAGLSMGMSGDFAVAVEEGATVVRVGSMLYSGPAE